MIAAEAKPAAPGWGDTPRSADTDLCLARRSYVSAERRSGGGIWPFRSGREDLASELQTVATDADTAPTAPPAPGRRREPPWRVCQRLCRRRGAPTKGAGALAPDQHQGWTRPVPPRRGRGCAGCKQATTTLDTTGADIDAGAGDRTLWLDVFGAEVAYHRRSWSFQRSLSAGRVEDLVHPLVADAQRCSDLSDRRTAGMNAADRVLEGDACALCPQLTPERAIL